MSTVNVAGKNTYFCGIKVKSRALREVETKVLTDHFPFPMNLSPHYLLNSFSSIGSSFPLALQSSSTTWSFNGLDFFFYNNLW
ncbi:hypothetical protein NC652_019215 [Populus alba x Populus x berolinensis]|nr:hypothetical protein NC652_019215 [Populus alba x Populus x berolinensis]